MAKCLLHGGFKGLTEPAWQAYFAEIFCGGDQEFAHAHSLNVVLVPWASSPKQWQNMAKKLAERCTKYWPEVRCDIQIAQTPEDLARLSQTADIVYCHGGIFIEAMTRGMRQVCKDLKTSKVKIFTGFSAGAYGLATTYYNAPKKAATEGGGLFNAAVCCHYNQTRTDARKILATAAPKQKLCLLEDGSFVWVSAATSSLV